MDPDNPVIKLCTEGLKAAAKNNHDDALRFYTDAWNIRKNSLDACIAAHYLAKEQKAVADILQWNLKSLSYAKKSDHETVKNFFPSLYINIADAYERLGKRKKAYTNYMLAAESIKQASTGSHGILLTESVALGIKRTKDKLE